MRAAIRPYPLVFFLLGDRYLTAVDPPVPAGPGQRLVFFDRPGDARLEGPGVTLVPTGKELYRTYGANEIALKGAMFLALARAVAAAPDTWLPAIHADATGAAGQEALAAGLRAMA